MEQVLSYIASANSYEIEELYNALAARYAVLFPNYEINFLSFEKDSDRIVQIDRVVAFLQGLKEYEEQNKIGSSRSHFVAER